MPKVSFTKNLQRHIKTEECVVDGATVGAALEQVFQENPTLRSYVLDDQGAVRKHMGVFVDGDLIQDRTSLSDPVKPDSEVFVVQALSGG